LSGASFEVVFVCTGNRFRSPLAEALFRRATTGFPVSVSSRGTLDLGPAPPLPEAAHEARRLGVDLSEHRARPVVASALSDVDLVVGFERMHVLTAVVDANAAGERTFTLPEVVGLLGDRDVPAMSDSVVRARHAVTRAAAARSADPMLLSIPELADPLGGPPELFRRTADELVVLTNRLVAGLFG
jgi:protein-tyrosine phosphatase